MTRGQSGRSLKMALPVAGLGLLALAVAVSAGQPQFTNEVWGDEFLLPWYGKQVLAGRVPYVDFFVFLGPLAPYGSAALEAVAGVGVTPFRVLNVAVVVFSTLAIHAILRFTGLGRIGAWAGAAWFPLLLFAIWPMSNHQWIATALALGSLWCIATNRHSAGRCIAAGTLCSCSGLLVQTVGVVVLLTILVWILVRPRPDRMIRPVMLGLLVPVLGCSMVLLFQGAFGAFIRYAVLWPLDSYVQTGGFNDGSLALLIQQRPVQSLLSQSLPSESLTYALVLALALAAFILPILAAVVQRRSAARSRSGIAIAAGVCLVLVVFDMGRSDMPHLAYLAPTFILATAAGCGIVRSRRLSLLLTVFLAGGAAIGGIRWSQVWMSNPPDVGALLQADESIESRVHTAIIDQLDNARRTDAPIVYLSRSAAVLYTYWSPRYPPIEWIAAPSWRSNTPAQYERLADYIHQQRIPFILVGRQDAGMLTDPSPVRSVLMAEYRLEKEIPVGQVYVRVPR